MKQDDILFYVAMMPPAFLLFIIIITIIYNVWYRKNYKDENGWHKCWDCKSAESEMYFKDTWHGRIYRCGECSKIK